MSKLHGVVPQNLVHQSSKNEQTGRPQNFLGANLDDFKYGFPSNGLSTVSNKWWGRSSHGGYKTGNDIDEAEHEFTEGDDLITVEMNKDKNEVDKDDESQGTALLTAARKRRMEEGREALKQGVFRYDDLAKLSKRENMLLLQIFKSSIPSQWLHGSS